MNENLRYLRKSHVILIGDLIFLEIIFIFFYLIINVAKSIILPYFDVLTQDQAINILGIIYFIFLSLFELILILVVVLRWASEEYEINEDTIEHKHGVFSIKHETYSLRSLGNATITQGIMGRIFNFGTIKLYSAMLKQEYFITNIHNPHQVLKYIEDDLSHSNEKGTIIRRG